MIRRPALALGLVAGVLAGGGASLSAQEPAVCSGGSEWAMLDRALPRAADRLRTGLPVRIVALGSSSTEGVGASSPAQTYPAQLEAFLQRRFPGQPITVANRGKGGETATGSFARFDRDVFPFDPHLVIWQVGSNELLQRRSLTANFMALANGIARLRRAGIEVVVMDVQFAPDIAEDADLTAILDGIRGIAARAQVPVFHRYALMRSWFERGPLDYGRLLSGDGLHLNDAGYGCIAVAVGAAILQAAGMGGLAER